MHCFNTLFTSCLSFIAIYYQKILILLLLIKIYLSLKNENFVQFLENSCLVADQYFALKSRRVLCKFTQYSKCLDKLRSNEKFVEISNLPGRESSYLKRKLFPSLETNTDNSCNGKSGQSNKVQNENHPPKPSIHTVEVIGISNNEQSNEFRKIITKISGIKSISNVKSALSNRFQIIISPGDATLKSIADNLDHKGYVLHTVITNSAGQEIISRISRPKIAKRPAYPKLNKTLERTALSKVDIGSKSEKQGDTFADSFRSFFKNSFFW